MELERLKKEFEENEKSLDRMGEQIEFSSRKDNKEYIMAMLERDKYKKELEPLEEALDTQSRERIAQLQAAEKKSSPFGPIHIYKNLFDNIKKSIDWQKEFFNKYKLEIKEDESERKLQFSTKEKNIQIEILQEKISGSWKKESEQTAIPMMIELYLKAIENQKIDKHIVEGKNPEVTQLIQLELAKQLKAKGLAQGEINNKKIDEILSLKASESAALKH